MIDNTYIDTLVFEISSQKHYDLAVAICPNLAEIDFEAVHGHFFGLSAGPLQFAVIPPGALSENKISLMSGEMKKLNIMRLFRTPPFD